MNTVKSLDNLLPKASLPGKGPKRKQQFQIELARSNQKMCWTCTTVLSRSEFPKTVSTWDGLRTICRHCIGDARKQSRVKANAAFKEAGGVKPKRPKQVYPTDIVIGRRYGWLVVEGSEIHAQVRLWRCLCDCGCVALKRAYDLRNGISWNCGCQKRVKRIEPKIALQSRFGRWTVLSDLGFDRSTRKHLLVCLCECGIVSSKIHQSSLLKGTSQSCGCLALEKSIAAHTLYPSNCTERPCFKCGQVLPRAAFRTRTKESSQLKSYCRECEKESERQGCLSADRRYSRRSLNLPRGTFIPPELIELKSAHILLNRLLKEKTND